MFQIGDIVKVVRVTGVLATRQSWTYLNEIGVIVKCPFHYDHTTGTYLVKLDSGRGSDNNMKGHRYFYEAELEKLKNGIERAQRRLKRD